MNRLLNRRPARGLLLVLMVDNHAQPAPDSDQPAAGVRPGRQLPASLSGLPVAVSCRAAGCADGGVALRCADWRGVPAKSMTGALTFAVLSLRDHRPGTRTRIRSTNMVHLYLAQPTRAVVSALLLLYQPPLLDILPMILLFLLVHPFILDMLVHAGFRSGSGRQPATVVGRNAV